MQEVTALCCHMLPHAYDTATGRRRIGFAVQKHRVRKGLEVQDSCVKRGPVRKTKTGGKKNSTMTGRMTMSLVRPRRWTDGV